MDDKEKKGISRRGALKTIAGGLIGATVVGLSTKSSEAQPVKPDPLKATRKPKIVLLGLDSCQMPKIIEWANQGKLPTFKKLLTQGSYGEFENIFRGMSVDAWAAYNTGVGPGQNNFFGSHPWQLYDRTAYQTSGINRLFRLHAASVPFMLAEAGVRVGLCGTAMSWPPERLKDGFMMSGKGAPGLGDGPDCKGHVYFTQRDIGLQLPSKRGLLLRMARLRLSLSLKIYRFLLN